MQPTFKRRSAYLGSVWFDVTDSTGSYTAELRQRLDSYEWSILNGDAYRQQCLQEIGILHREHCASLADTSFAIPAETVAAFNAWRLAEHNRHIATLDSAPDRYGFIGPADPIRKPPMVARRGRLVYGAAFGDARWESL